MTANPTIRDSLLFDGWVVICEWTPTESGTYPNAPSSISISPKDGSRTSGITSTVLRHIERAITEYAHNRRGSFPKNSDADFWNAMRASVEALPDGPRDKSGNYYRELLRLYEILDATEPNAARALHELTGKPLNTIMSQLARARNRNEQQT